MNQIVIGDFDGDLAGDAIVVSAGDAALLVKPEAYSYAVPVKFENGTTLSDVVGLTAVETVTSYRVDAFAATTPSGLLFCRWNGESFPNPLVVSDDEAWKSAKPIRSSNLDGLHGADLFGIRADRSSLVIALSTAAGWQSTLEYDLGDTSLHDVAAFDYDGDGELELALLGAIGVFFIKQDGSLIDIVAHNGPVGAIAVIDVASGPQSQLLAWVRHSNDGTSDLIVLGKFYSSGSIPLGFNLCGNPSSSGYVNPIAIVPGDYDLVNGDDLLLAHDDSSPNATFIVLRNQGNAPYFDTTSTTSYDVVEVAGPSYALPAFGQVGDGPEDILIPVPTQQCVEVFTEAPFEFGTQSLLQQKWTTPEIVQSVSEYPFVGANQSGTLHFAIHVPQVYQSYEAVELTLWEQVSAGETTYADSTPKSHFFHILDKPGGATSPFQYISIPNLPTGTTWSMGEHYYTEFRFVDINPAGNRATKASKIFLGGFAIKSVEEFTAEHTYSDEFLYLSGLGGNGSVNFEIEESNTLVLSEDNLPRIVIGAYTSPISKVPFDPEDIPFPGLGTIGGNAITYTSQ